MNGTVVALYISPKKGEPMQAVNEVRAIPGRGFEGDRYCVGAGSFSKASRRLVRWREKLLRQKHRQVTLISAGAFNGTGFTYQESRRNVVVSNEVHLPSLIGKEFQIGEAVLRGVKLCLPCNRPSTLVGKRQKFKDSFPEERGGLVAEIVRIRGEGIIRLDDLLIPPVKGY